MDSIRSNNVLKLNTKSLLQINYGIKNTIANHINQRRINQTIHLQQTREEEYIKSQVVQEMIKKTFDKRTKAEDFYLGYKFLKWDSRRKHKGKHGKFDFLWKGPYIIYAFRGNNAFFLGEMDGTEVERGPVNGQMLIHYIEPSY